MNSVQLHFTKKSESQLPPLVTRTDRSTIYHYIRLGGALHLTKKAHGMFPLPLTGIDHGAIGIKVRRNPALFHLIENGQRDVPLFLTRTHRRTKGYFIRTHFP